MFIMMMPKLNPVTSAKTISVFITLNPPLFDPRFLAYSLSMPSSCLGSACTASQPAAPIRLLPCWIASVPISPLGLHPLKM
jgi:hypothetical protein